MNFRIADAFQTSPTSLTGEERKPGKLAAFEFLTNAGCPELTFQPLG